MLLSLKQESNPALFAVRPTIPPMVVALPLPFIFFCISTPDDIVGIVNPSTKHSRLPLAGVRKGQAE